MAMPRSRATALVVSVVYVVSVVGLLAGCGRGTGDHPASPSPSPSPPSSVASSPAAATDRAAAAGLAAIEHRHHARLGVYAMDTGTGQTVSYRPDERFAHCSVFKALEGGVLFRRESDAGLAHLLHYSAADMEEYSPITRQHMGTGMTERQLVAAAMDYSDNTAANVLLHRLGGPHGLQSALRALGDRTTHNDRPEPGVNEAEPGDVRDTSTPRALATDLRRFALGSVLRPDRREEYTALLKKNTTGGPFIRAGVPQGWTVGDKTGNGWYGTRNDIAVLWPPKGAPIVLAVLSDRGRKDARSDDTLIADATRAVVEGLRP